MTRTLQAAMTRVMRVAMTRAMRAAMTRAMHAATARTMLAATTEAMRAATTQAMRAVTARTFRLAAAVALALGALLSGASASAAVVVEPREAWVLVGDDLAPPAPDDPRWQTTRLPDARVGPVVWYRLAFDRPAGPVDPPCMLYLPYLYGGGRIWLDGEPIATIEQPSAERRVSWERPHLLPLPVTVLRPGGHVLMLRTGPAAGTTTAWLAAPSIGPQRLLQPVHDARLFWVRTVPTLTVVTGTGVGLLFLLVWWRRRDEALYGLFGLAALLWAVRTNTFVLDAWPAAWWPAWRLLHHACIGGFVVLMALFALRLAGWSRPWLTRGLLAYWALGPLLFVFGGAERDELTSRWWGPGLVVVGIGLVVVGVASAVRQRTAASVVLAASLAVATAAGVHDYLLVRQPDWLAAALGAPWVDQRIFLLHHGANLLLVVMGGLLALRFVRTLRAVEEMNRTLEDRVRDREREIGASYARIAEMQREQAAVDERHRIMQDLHDGLGSRLLISLLQVERGALAPAEVAETLRTCIADMRLAIEALASDGVDFGTALGDFRFRWDGQLQDAGIASSWRIDAPADALALPPHATLQVLRVLQEALTNVVKHARASRVAVRVAPVGEALEIVVEDDGRGFGDDDGDAAAARGRGLGNMRTRAARLGGRLETSSGGSGTSVRLVLPR